VKVLVSGSLDDPERLGFGGRVEETLRLFEAGVLVPIAGDEQQRRPDVPDALDRGDGFGRHAEPRPDLQEEKRGQGRTYPSESNRNAVAHRLPKSGIDGFEDQRLHGKRGGREKRGSSSLRDSEVGHGLAGKLGVREPNRRLRIARLEMAERDV
jgi:hypothetical protein